MFKNPHNTLVAVIVFYILLAIGSSANLFGLVPAMMSEPDTTMNVVGLLIAIVNVALIIRFTLPYLFPKASNKP